jgi:hypothetical protein
VQFQLLDLVVAGAKMDARSQRRVLHGDLRPIQNAEISSNALKRVLAATSLPPLNSRTDRRNRDLLLADPKQFSFLLRNSKVCLLSNELAIDC